MSVLPEDDLRVTAGRAGLTGTKVDKAARKADIACPVIEKEATILRSPPRWAGHETVIVLS
jgi:hypothetical protein